jgi:hypothetical protein
MGDDVSKAEWKRRRASLDKEMAEDKELLKGDYSYTGGPDFLQKVVDRTKSDKQYKQTYAKELGYDAPKKVATSNGTAPKKAPAKKITRKRVTG